MKIAGYAKVALSLGGIGLVIWFLFAAIFFYLPSQFRVNSQADATLGKVHRFESGSANNELGAEVLRDMRQRGLVPKNSTAWFASPSGTKIGRGTIASPADIATALSGNIGESKIRPGDVIWLRGGRYLGSFSVYLEGTAAAPIHVRQFPGERAILDKASAGREIATLAVRGSHVWFWDFEVMNSFPNRVSLDPDGKLNPWRGSGINVWASNTKYINLIVHDNGHGFGIWNEGGGTEIYGCLIFNNGNNKKEHGVYAHNKNGTQEITDNIIFNNAGKGLHVFANSTKSSISGFNLDRNAVFNNGALTSEKQVSDQILVGGVRGVSADRISIRDNSIFNERDSPTGKNRGIRLGYEDDNNAEVKVADNFIVSRVPLKILWWRSVEARRNTVVSAGKEIEIQTPTGIDASSYFLESNIVLSGKSFATKVFVRPNQYEKGRANIFIHSDGTAEYVAVRLNAFFQKGDTFEIRDAQDYLGAPVMRGVFDGSDVRLPMNGNSTTMTEGKTERAPIHTSSEFAAFVVRKISG